MIVKCDVVKCKNYNRGGCKMPTIKWSIIVFLILASVITYFEQVPNIEISVPTKIERSK